MDSGVEDIDPRRMGVYEEQPNRYAAILQERRKRKFERQERKRNIPHLNKHMRETAKARWEIWSE